jgi:hypothetical protein
MFHLETETRMLKRNFRAQQIPDANVFTDTHHRHAEINNLTTTHVSHAETNFFD